MVTATRLLVFCLIGLSLAVPVLGATSLSSNQNVLQLIGVVLVVIALFAGAFILQPKGKEAGIYWIGAAVIAALAISSLFGANTGNTVFAQVNPALNTAILLAGLVLAGATFSKIDSRNNQILGGTLFVALVAVIALLNQAYLNSATQFASIVPLNGAEPNVPASLAIVFGALVAAVLIVEKRSERLLFGIGATAILLTAALGLADHEGQQKFAVVGPLINSPDRQASFDANVAVFVKPEEVDGKQDVLLAQFTLNNKPLRVTHYSFYSGPDAVGNAEDVGLSKITAVAPGADPNTFIVAGPDMSLIQQTLVTVVLADGVLTPIASADIPFVATDIFQTTANGVQTTVLTSEETTSIATQTPNPVTEFNPDLVVPAITQIDQSTPDTLTGIVDGSIVTIDIGSQTITPLDIPATAIIPEPTIGSSLTEATPNFIPDNSILTIADVNGVNTAQFVDLGTGAITTLGAVAASTGTLTTSGNLVTLGADGTTAFSATVTPNALTNYQSLPLGSNIPVITLSDASLAAVAPAQILTRSTRDIEFNAYAVDASTFMFQAVIPANSQIEVGVFATAQPIDAQQAAQLTPRSIWTFSNPYDYSVRVEQEGYADLTSTYISIQTEYLGPAESPNWVASIDPGFIINPDTAVVSPQSSFSDLTNTLAATNPDAQIRYTNTFAEQNQCLAIPNVICVYAASNPSQVMYVTTLDQAQACAALTNTVCVNSLATANTQQIRYVSNIADYAACTGNPAYLCVNSAQPVASSTTVTQDVTAANADTLTTRDSTNMVADPAPTTVTSNQVSVNQVLTPTASQ